MRARIRAGTARARSCKQQTLAGPEVGPRIGTRACPCQVSSITGIYEPGLFGAIREQRECVTRRLEGPRRRVREFCRVAPNRSRSRDTPVKCSDRDLHLDITPDSSLIADEYPRRERNARPEFLINTFEKKKERNVVFQILFFFYSKRSRSFPLFSGDLTNDCVILLGRDFFFYNWQNRWK